MEKTLKLSFIGNGNLAYQFIHAFHRAGLQNIEVFARDKEKSNRLFGHLNVKLIDEIKELTGEAIFICTNDESIAEVANLIAGNTILIHGSGSTSLSTLPGSKRGVLYPIQTLSSSIELNFESIPLCITTDNIEVKDLLYFLANAISKTVKVVTDEERLTLHCAAVILNNFINHLAKRTHQFVEERNIDYTLLKPILDRTFQKIKSSPLDFHQTGPAKRNDQTTMLKHHHLLNDDPDLLAVYKTISNSIYNYENSKRDK